MNGKTLGLLWLMLLLVACSTAMPTRLPEAAPTPTASPMPTVTAEAQQSGLQVVVFYSPL